MGHIQDGISFSLMALVYGDLMKCWGIDPGLFLGVPQWPNHSWVLGLLRLNIDYPVDLPVMHTFLSWPDGGQVVYHYHIQVLVLTM